MGYTLDSRGKPTYTPSPTQTVADLTAAVEYADKVGGLLKLTAAERESITPGDSIPGWLIAETDTGFLYQVTSSEPQGVLIGGVPRTAGVAPAGGISFSPNKLLRAGSLVTIHAYAAKGSAFAASELVGTIPVGFRPAADWAAATLHYTGGYGVVQNIVQINPAGEIRVNVASIASQYAFIVGSWPVA